MMIINYCVVKFGAQNVYELFNSFYQGNYTCWFYVYCWSAQYVSNRLCQYDFYLIVVRLTPQRIWKPCRNLVCRLLARCCRRRSMGSIRLMLCWRRWSLYSNRSRSHKLGSPSAICTNSSSLLRQQLQPSVLFINIPYRRDNLTQGQAATVRRGQVDPCQWPTQHISNLDDRSVQILGLGRGRHRLTVRQGDE